MKGKRLRTGFYLDAILFGITLGFGACAGYVTILSSIEESSTDLLITYAPTLATLFVGALALKGVSSQIQSAANEIERSRIAKLNAAVSILPLVLSRVCSIAENRCNSLASGRLNSEAGEAWEITATEIDTIKECIELSTEDERILLRQIPRIYQVLIARWSTNHAEDLYNSQNFTSPPADEFLIQQQMYAIEDWAVLYGVCSSLFGFSRGQKFEFSKGEIKEAALTLLSRLDDGGPNGKGGKSLRTNPQFRNFLEERQGKEIIHTNLDVWV